MTPRRAHEQPSSELATLVVEAIERQLSAGPAGELLDEALRRAGISTVPETAETLVFFVTGALCEVAEANHGEAVADALMRGLGPVLDKSWEVERLELTGGVASTAPPMSAVARRESGVRRSADREQPAEEADTIPAPADLHAQSYANEAGLTLPQAASVIISDKPPSSRMTVPYLASALAPDSRATTIVVADQDPASREHIADTLRRLGCLVATAESRFEARQLIRRLHPRVLVADIETIAPDFEPLGPTFEELLHEVPQPAVVLVGEAEPRELTEQVVGSLIKPIEGADVLELVEPHLGLPPRPPDESADRET